MYRPPEICDLYKGLVVNEKVDIWMLGKYKCNFYMDNLGCTMYTICFYIHPFFDSSSSAISEANYDFPEDA